MDLHDRLFRLKHLSPAELPRLLGRRVSRLGRAVLERALYTPRGPRRPSPRRQVRRLGLFHPSVHRPGFRDSFRLHFASDAETLIQTANQAATLTVDLFGRPVQLKQPIPWHAAWPPTVWFSKVQWGAGADVRMVWELSRCSHFVTLGQAYALTGDDRFAKAFSDQIEDWMRRNPPNFGVNWASSMEIAMRAANWIAAWEFFSDSKAVSAFVRANLGGSLWEHGRHISRHLEWGGELSTNHYLANLMGLSYIGEAIGEPAWAEFARTELVREIQSQTYLDGFDFEGSTAYHRLVTEIFFYFSLVSCPGLHNLNSADRRETLASRNGKAFVERLRAMFKMGGALTAPNGQTPLIGDNDSARVHWLFRREDADMRYLADFGAAFLGEDRSRVAGTPTCSETAWLFGCEAAIAVSPLGVPPTRVLNLRPGPSGFVTLRGTRDATWFLMTPNGTRGVGNHAHNDKLSILLSVGADDFLVDPGTVAYSGDPERRNLFRSTASHSTVMVDGVEQNRFSPDNLFMIADDAAVSLDDFKEAVRVAGSHTGYRRLDSPVTHHRSLQRMSDPLGWVMEDELTGNGHHELQWSFVCGPLIQVSLREDGTAVLKGTEGTLEIRPHVESLGFKIEDGAVAPAYGTSVPNRILRANWKGSLPMRATFTLAWRSVGERA